MELELRNEVMSMLDNLHEIAGNNQIVRGLDGMGGSLSRHWYLLTTQRTEFSKRKFYLIKRFDTTDQINISFGEIKYEYINAVLDVENVIKDFCDVKEYFSVISYYDLCEFLKYL